jgi:hypothetical protein
VAASSFEENGNNIASPLLHYLHNVWQNRPSIYHPRKHRTLAPWRRPTRSTTSELRASTLPHHHCCWPVQVNQDHLIFHATEHKSCR